VSIFRIFRVLIYPDLRSEFEEKFESISVNAVKNSPGAISVRIVKPTKWTPDEYAMVSEWENEDALIRFAGDRWNHAFIPPGMEKFTREYWVHHYNSWA
jgi:heme-degrading monooxygenase HmoA